MSENIIYAQKVRNSQTGEIVETRLEKEAIAQDCIIVDDICDGGRTFIELAKVLKSKGAKDIYLYVTHGIFSKGIEVLREHFNHIYCYHLINYKGNIDNNFLTVFNPKEIENV